MSTNTPINGLQLPQLGDPPNIENDFAAFGNAIDARINPIFATVAARDAAITSPAEGMLAYCIDTDEQYIYSGSTWVSNRWRIKYCTASTTLASTTYVNITGVSFPVEANSLYLMIGAINYQVNASDDIKWMWSVPAGATGFWRIRLNVTDGMSITGDTVIATNGAGEFEPIYGGYISTVGTAGTANLQAGKQTDVSTDGTVFAAGCWIGLLKVS